MFSFIKDSGVIIIKIVSWNCCCAFRKKFQFIECEAADIYVIQECENPDKYKKEFLVFPYKYYWIGKNQNKGLCVFVKEKYDTKIHIFNDNYNYFLSIQVDGIIIVGVWANSPYIEEYFEYQKENIQQYTDKTILIGDFNSNAKWNSLHGEKNHTTVVDELKQYGFISAYHYSTTESQGCETTNTFYLHRNAAKGHHIDYCFLKPDMLNEFKILDDPKWLEHSDHMPLILSCVSN